MDAAAELDEEEERTPARQTRAAVSCVPCLATGQITVPATSTKALPRLCPICRGSGFRLV